MRSGLWQALTATAVTSAAAAALLVAAAPAMADDQVAMKRGIVSLKEAPAPFDAVATRAMKEGIEEGSLTEGEIAHLRKIETRLQFMEQLMRQDGKFTAWERKHLATARVLFRRMVMRDRINRDFRIDPEHLKRRIKLALDEGALTEDQAKRLEELQAGVAAMSKSLQADQIVTERDRVRVWRAQFRIAQAVNFERRILPVRKVLGERTFERTLRHNIASGRILWNEAHLLRLANIRVTAMRKAAESDGRVTPAEETKLTAARRDLKRMVREARAQHREAVEKARLAAFPVSSGSGWGSGGSAVQSANAYRRAAAGFARSTASGMRAVGRFLGGH